MNIKTNAKRKNCKSGFTLIEMLIVIGLLGALTALILPSLSGSREDALLDVCDYNQAGTVRVLKQFKQITGEFPADMHTGLNAGALPATRLDGIPAGAGNALTGVALTDVQATSLNEAGIDSLAYDYGYNTIAATAGVPVVVVTEAWVDDGGPGSPLSFDGIRANVTPASGTRSWIDEDADGIADGIVIQLRIAPTTNWDKSGSGGNNDWSQGNFQVGIDLEGSCPIPVYGQSNADESDFAYYCAYFKVYDGVDTDFPATTPAKLIGTSCPEDGVMNP